MISTLGVLVWIHRLQALGLSVAALIGMFLIWINGSLGSPTTWAIFVVEWMFVLWMVATARGVRHKHSWSRASSVALELFLLAVAWNVFEMSVFGFFLSALIAIPAGVAFVLAITSHELRNDSSKGSRPKQERAF